MAATDESFQWHKLEFVNKCLISPSFPFRTGRNVFSTARRDQGQSIPFWAGRLLQKNFGEKSDWPALNLEIGNVKNGGIKWIPHAHPRDSDTNELHFDPCASRSSSKKVMDAVLCFNNKTMLLTLKPSITQSADGQSRP